MSVSLPQIVCVWRHGMDEYKELIIKLLDKLNDKQIRYIYKLIKAFLD